MSLPNHPKCVELRFFNKNQLLSMHSACVKMLNLYESKQYQMNNCTLCDFANSVEIDEVQVKLPLCYYCPWIIFEGTTCDRWFHMQEISDELYEITNRSIIIARRSMHPEFTSMCIPMLKKWIAKIKEQQCRYQIILNP